jgi:hypothetical protein
MAGEAELEVCIAPQCPANGEGRKAKSPKAAGALCGRDSYPDVIPEATPNPNIHAVRPRGRPSSRPRRPT